MRILLLILSTAFFSSFATAGPWLAPGDSAIRHDVQLLADAGVITGAVTTWPLAWGDIAADIAVVPADLPPDQAAALLRLQRHSQQATVVGRTSLTAYGSAAANPRRIRTFEDGPREDAEVGVALERTGNWFAFNLEAQWVDAEDGDELRADGSYLGLALGNWMLAAAIADQWWGPAWQGSVILGSNSRPIPAFTIGRNSTAPFESPWLSWIGAWDLAAFWGFLESDREVPDARLFGMRVTVRPFRSLELGLSRTAIWCGRGVDCGFNTFKDVWLGDSGDSDPYSEGDQRAGWDARWSGRLFSRPIAIYGSMIGEDSANRLPSSWFGQFGGETTGYITGLGSYRVYLDWADTECDFRFYQSIRNDNDGTNPRCGYNNATYRTGYRYKGRSIGHSFDGDASVFTLGGVLIDDHDRSWIATIAVGNLNRRQRFTPETRNSVANIKTRYREVELVHRRTSRFGELNFGLGYEIRREADGGDTDNDFRIFARWQKRVW